jgi:hypothetical protein
MVLYLYILLWNIFKIAPRISDSIVVFICVNSEFDISLYEYNSIQHMLAYFRFWYILYCGS